MSCAVKSDKSIQGITINDQEIKILQYADDTTGVFKNLKTAQNFPKILNKFYEVSGLKLTIEKN